MDVDTSQSLPWIVLALPLPDQHRRAASNAAAGNSRVQGCSQGNQPIPSQVLLPPADVTKLLLERAPSTPASDSSQCFQAGIMLTKLSSTPSSEFRHENTSTPFCLMRKNSLPAPVLPRPGAGRGSSSPGTAQHPCSPCTLPVLLQLQHRQPFPAFASVPFPERPIALTQLVAPAGHVPMSPEMGPWLPLLPASSSQQYFCAFRSTPLKAGL